MSYLVLKIVKLNQIGAPRAAQSLDFPERHVRGCRISLRHAKVIKIGRLIDMVSIIDILVGIFHISNFRPHAGLKLTVITVFSVKNYGGSSFYKISRTALTNALYVPKVVLGILLDKVYKPLFGKKFNFSIY